MDVLFSSTFKSLPAAGDGQLRRQQRADPAEPGPAAVGRRSQATINIVEPTARYGQRLNQLDLRFKRCYASTGRLRASINFDLYNALNGSAITSQNNNYAAWQVPLSILDARLFKISAQVDF